MGLTAPKSLSVRRSNTRRTAQPGLDEEQYKKRNTVERAREQAGGVEVKTALRRHLARRSPLRLSENLVVQQLVVKSVTKSA